MIYNLRRHPSIGPSFSCHSTPLILETS
uniref:Uncharacterized protein n=1 Tax=Arundo donax TaxID=35708 RepID=A0A0A9EFP0_ARUDO